MEIQELMLDQDGAVGMSFGYNLAAQDIKGVISPKLDPEVQQ